MKNTLLIFSALLIFSTVCLAQFQMPNDSLFLKPTAHINSDHPAIIAKALEITSNLNDDLKKVKAIYEFVRDSHNSNDCKSYIASEVLAEGGNSCVRRSILIAALCRAVGIPARLHNQIVTIKSFVINGNELGDYTFVHGLAGVKYDDKWFLIEPVGNKMKWNLWNDGKDMGEEGVLAFNDHKNNLFPQTEIIILRTVPIYFSDYDEFYRAYIDKMYSAEIGWFE